MKKFGIFALVAAFAVVLTMVPEVAMAEGAGDAGNSIGKDIYGLITGSMGTLIGLGIALLGLYSWIVKQETWGIMMIIGGVAVTAFPGVFDSMREGFSSALSETGATGADKKFTEIGG